MQILEKDAEGIKGELHDEPPIMPRLRAATVGAPPVKVDPASLYNYVLPPCTNVGRNELVVAVIVLLLWILFFMLGLFVPTYQLQSNLLGGNQKDFASSLLIMAITYTLTNVFFLTCLAAVVGCMAHRWQVSDGTVKIPDDAKSIGPTRLYLSCLLRAFFLYLMFTAGFLIVSPPSNLLSLTADQYMRIAGLMSTLGFIVGYDPNLLVQWMEKVLKAVDRGDKDRPLSA